jgi:hypothetical protein
MYCNVCISGGLGRLDLTRLEISFWLGALPASEEGPVSGTDIRVRKVPSNALVIGVSLT